MRYLQGLYPVINKANPAGGIFDLEILCPQMAELAVPGQFVHIKAEGFFLRRPISICGINKERGTLRIVFACKGEGTKKLADLRKGDMADMIGPLGQGFDLSKAKERAVLVGGGIGVPPMLSLAKELGSKATAISGFRDKSLVILQKDFAAFGADTVLCTDDGSAGLHGFVTAPLEEILSGKGADIVYACGPKPMLKNIAALCEKYSTACEVSLEERMACGVGACLGCACDIKEEKGGTVRRHVCKNGPVFDAREVVF